MRELVLKKWQRFRELFSQTPVESRYFLVLALVFGLLFVALTPPLKAPDEPQHYYRSYQISRLHFLAHRFEDGRYGDRLPANVVEFGGQSLIREAHHDPPGVELMKRLAHESYSQRVEEVRFDNTAVYSPIGYVASSIGLGLSRLLHMPLLWGYYLGRISNILVWIALVFIAIVVTPLFRWAFLAISLLPMTIFQAASFSPDATTNGLACLAVALFLHAILRVRFTNRLKMLTVLCVTSLGLTKQVYVLFLIPFLLLPATRFSGAKDRRNWVALISIIPVAFSTIWLILSLNIASQLKVMFALGNVSAIQQLIFILHHPFSTISILGRTFFGSQSDYLTKGVVGLLGWGTISLPTYIYMLIAAVVTLAVIAKEPAPLMKYLTVRIRLGLLLSSVALFLGVCASLYFSFTVVGAQQIAGLQGRYFIPILFLLIPVIASSKLQLQSSSKYHTYAILGSICLILLVSLYTLYQATYLQAFI